MLKVLLKLKQPGSILEVGTAVGYSSILMSENMPKDWQDSHDREL